MSCVVLHREPEKDRLQANELARLRSILVAQGVQLHDGTEVDQRLDHLRKMYEPYVYSLADHLCLAVPDWITESGRADNWQISAWGRNSDPREKDLPAPYEKEHFQ